MTNIETQTEQITSTELSNLIVEAIQDKKGAKIISLDLRKIDDAMADYFIICEATNPVQVKAIGENILFEVKQQTGDVAIGKEGFAVSEWVLVDYFNVVVHVFYAPIREKYQLEELWGDAERKEYDDLF